MTFRTRFAPSPTGPLHLGHAYSALVAYELAKARNGDFLLRIEDIDQDRSKPEWETQIYRDLSWLGIDWPTPVLRQSENMPRYRAALETLWKRGLLYVCRCNRKDIRDAASAPQEGGAPLIGPDGIVYPGTCRPGTPASGQIPQGFALRLDMKRALSTLSNPITFNEIGENRGTHVTTHTDMLNIIGDVVLARREMGTSYHLSVVIDDAYQGINTVVRGADLFDATPIHVLLQTLLGLDTPTYYHHRLIRDASGKRLAKRDDARAISKYRADGASPKDLRALIGL